MARTTYVTLFGLIGLSLTSCSWFVNLIVANNSQKDILVRYLVQSDNVSNQFFENPKTYEYSEQLSKLYRRDPNK